MFWGRVKFLLQVALAMALTTAGFELFLRFSGTCQPPPYKTDSRFGSVMKPNANAVFVNEGFRLAKVNEYGYLGPSYPPEKEQGTVRIVLIGDSFVAGREVLKNLDLFKEVGARKAFVREYKGISADNGQLVIGFTPNIENPQICGIEILPE